MSFEVMIKNIDHYIKGIFNLDRVLSSVRMFPWFVGQYSMWDILPMKHVAESISVTANGDYQLAEVPVDEDWLVYGFSATLEDGTYQITRNKLTDAEDFCVVYEFEDGSVFTRHLLSSEAPFLAAGGTHLKTNIATYSVTGDMRQSLYWKAMKKAQWKA